MGLKKIVRGLILTHVFGMTLGFGIPVLWASDPAINTWRWDQVLDRMEHDMVSVGSSCRVWLDNYGTNQYREWKRCSVGSTSSGITVIDYTFGVTDSQTFLSLANPTPWVSLSKDGTGAINTAASGPSSGGTHYYSNTVVITPAGAMSLNMPNQQLLSSNYTTSCTGAWLSGTMDAPGSVNQQWFTLLGSYVRDTTTAHNTESSACTAGDSLVIDFGTVSPTCTQDNSVVMGFRGREHVMANCSCIPLGFGITDFTPPNTCMLTQITGDPSKPPGYTDKVGSAVRQSGTTFTNEDLMGETYFPGQVPTIGSSPNGGIAEGIGAAGSPAGTYTPGANGGGQSGGISGGSGTGSYPAAGTGAGNCPAGVQNCNGDGSTDSGFIPGTSSFDSGITSPETGDWQSSITTFISGSPLVSAISGSHVSATSGDCSQTFTVWGSSATISLCSHASWFELGGTFLLIAANLAAFYIVWRN